jgi:hypothetical protein
MILTSELLNNLLSPDGGIRSHAESVLRSIPVAGRVEALMTQLLSLSNNPTTPDGSNDGALSLLAAVLLRRDILKLRDPSMLIDLVAPLLKCYGKSTTSRVQIGHCLAEICASLSILRNGGDENDDPASHVLSTILGTLNSQDDVSLRLFAILGDRAPIAFAKIAFPSLPALVSNANLTNPSTLASVIEILVSGAIATSTTTVSLVRTTPNLDELVIDGSSRAAQLGSTLLELLGPISTCPDESTVLECLQHLCHAATTCPSLLAGQLTVLQGIVQLCLGLAVQPASDNEYSTVPLSALLVLASLVSVADIRHRILSPALAKEIADTSIPVCARLMAEGIEVESFHVWMAEPATLVGDGIDGDENDDALFAESLIESFLQYLAGPAFNVAMPLVQHLLQHSPTHDWRHARAACAILEIGLVVAPMGLTNHIPEIIKIASFLGEDHSSSSGGATINPRVQYQVLRLLGALCETHTSVRELYGQFILERMAQALNSPITKVSSTACLGIISYCRGGGKADLDVEQSLVPFLPDLVRALIQGPLSFGGFDTGTVTARVHAMGAVACLAEASGEAYVPYYSNVMQGLLGSIQLPQVDIAAAALVSLTIVGQAVGKDVFQYDAEHVMSSIVPLLQSGHQPSTSFPIDELLVACARIAAVLEEDFEPYIDSVMPSLYKIAQEPADVSFMEGNESGIQNEDYDLDGASKSITVAVPGRGFTRVTINTTGIQQKAAVNRSLYEMAKALGPVFGPHAPNAMEIFLPLVKFPYSADVRSTAALALSALMDCACSFGEEIGTMAVPQRFLPLLSDAISEQIAEEDSSDVEALHATADSLSETYYIVFRFRNSSFGSEILKGLTIMHAERVVDRCMTTMVACLERRGTLTRVLQGNLTGDDEREEYNSQLRAEDALLTPLVDSVGYLIKFFRNQFVPLFDRYLVPVLCGYLSLTNDVRARVASMCLYDDCVEYCGPDAAERHGASLMQGLVGVMEGPMYERDLIQAAVYGVAQLARYAPSNLMGRDIQPIVFKLLALTEGSKDENEDGIYLFEIAISALASLTLLGPFQDLKFVNRVVVMDRFLNNIPIQHDEDEAKVSTTTLTL